MEDALATRKVHSKFTKNDRSEAASRYRDKHLNLEKTIEKQVEKPIISQNISQKDDS